MKTAVANIHWLSHDEGGRKVLPAIGVLYYPHIILSNSTECQPWSVSFQIAPVDSARNSTISFSMLADNVESQAFFSHLRVGMEFKLLEGKKVVAIGIIQRL